MDGLRGSTAMRLGSPPCKGRSQLPGEGAVLQGSNEDCLRGAPPMLSKPFPGEAPVAP